jgi:hypothetical protein
VLHVSTDNHWTPYSFNWDNKSSDKLKINADSVYTKVEVLSEFPVAEKHLGNT